MKSQEAKSSLWVPQSEKPNHYTYLKEFRVEQCQLFLQHKCTQHRPYTCFHWHFLNQRRRRPIRKKDGTFNYSPDNYCTKFDENTGICEDGDDCALLHRTSGDTERRYHLRYYKTGMCVHDTDTRGMCAKNGAHCAFAHGADDVRPPVYDIRELQAIESGENELTNGIGPNSLDKERNMINEDPKWQDTAFVLANYKTETCKRPPRLCRQGYACPMFHNSRDKRRPPRNFKYRSTACPNVKHGDEWGDPANCESGDACQYCHTRTEQQFHPEIYKSTKCNDMQQNGYCPRGPFCAFAHEQEHEIRETLGIEAFTGTSFAEILQSALPQELNPPMSASVPHTFAPNLSSVSIPNNSISDVSNYSASIMNSSSNYSNNVLAECNGILNGDAILTNSLPSNSIVSQFSNISMMPPIGSKPRSLSGNGNATQHPVLRNVASNGPPPGLTNMPQNISTSRDPFNSAPVDMFAPGSLPVNFTYAKAPGSEREDRETVLRKQWAAIDNDPDLDITEKTKRKRSLILASVNTPPPTGPPPGLGPMLGDANSAFSTPFYPTGDPVQSVGTALDELNIDESTNLNNIENRSNSLTSSIIPDSVFTAALMGSSAPVNIPGSAPAYHELNNTTNRSQSPSSSPSGFSSHLHNSLNANSINSFEQTSSFLRHNGGFGESMFGASPHNFGLSQSPLVSSFGGSISDRNNEIQRLRTEHLNSQAKIAKWENALTQAVSTCHAWKREAEQAKGKAQISGQEREELISKLSSQQKELEELRNARNAASLLPSIQPQVDLNQLPLHTLKTLQNRLKKDLNQVEKAITDVSLKGDQWPGVVSTW